MGLAPYGATEMEGEEARYFMHGHLIDNSLDMEVGRSHGLQHLGRTFSDTVDDDNLFRHYASLAFRVQRDLEDVATSFVRALLQRTGQRNVAFAGGVALNSSLNGRICDMHEVAALHVPAFPGDDGIALGCATFAHALRRAARMESATTAAPQSAGVTAWAKLLRDGMPRAPLLGRRHGRRAVWRALQHFAPWVTARAVDDAAGAAADIVARGGIVMWFSGRSEYGPRALGARSLLADARRRETHELVNARVKGREMFRPLAPAVRDVDAGRFFHGVVGDAAGEGRECEVMEMTRQVTAEGREKLQAVVHVDGTARVQVVRAGDGGTGLYEVLGEVARRTGVGVVMNTSMNVAGEPIVESVEQAVEMFLKVADDVEALVCEGVVVRRREWTGMETWKEVGSGCGWFRWREVGDESGGLLRVDVTYVERDVGEWGRAAEWEAECGMGWEGESESRETMEEGAGDSLDCDGAWGSLRERTEDLEDELEMELLRTVHGSGATGLAVEVLEEEVSKEVGVTRGEVSRRLEGLFRKRLVWRQ